MRAHLRSLVVAALLGASCASDREPTRGAPPEFPETVWIRWCGTPVAAARPDAAARLDGAVDASPARGGRVATRFRAGAGVTCAGMPDAPRVRVAYEPTGEAVDVDGETWERYRRSE
jgi:hypothetical protein